MENVNHAGTENILLAKTPGDVFERLRPHLERVTLEHGQHVIVPDEPIRYVYFPTGCLLSLVTRMEDGTAVESGTIGREGMSGIPVILKAKTTTMETLTQVPGEAVRIRSEHIREEYDRGGPFHDLLNRYMHIVVVNGSQSAACNAIHRVDARFCRWLLMSSDGIGSHEVALTHEYLAVMLGVRRATVTEVALKVQDAGLISYHRGRIKIRDRAGLEALACECYARTKAEYERLFSD
jgi:CRP-like cAMP-binding protein